MNGFLDDIPDLAINTRRKRHKTPAPPVEEPVVVVKYIRPKCPFCGSKQAPCYDSNNLPIRYHRYSQCGKSFKSVETDE